MAITRASIAANGTQTNGSSTTATLSADGTKVAFTSTADNLGVEDANDNSDIYVKDMSTGVVTRASSTASGGQATGGGSYNAVLSADGTKVVFSSDASNLVDGISQRGLRLYYKDLTTGAIARVDTTINASPNANLVGEVASISADGTKVVFQGNSNDFVAGDTNGYSDIFIKDMSGNAITRVSTTATGGEANGNSSYGVLSADGTKVAFLSAATNLVDGDTNGATDLFVKDLSTGAVVRANTALGGAQADAGVPGGLVSLSADGTKVAFASAATNLVAGDTNAKVDVFVKDLTTGVVTRVSTAADGTEANNSSSTAVSLSADGTKVVFASSADNLVAGDTNGVQDIFVKDLASGAIYRLNTAADGTQGGASASIPSISADGTKVAFQSSATNLVPNDTNRKGDVFVTESVCYAEGTAIRVFREGAERDVSVEALSVGDLAVTSSGARRPIRWLGHRVLDCASHPEPARVRPVRIAKDAFGEGRPARDLLVSPAHAIAVDILGEVLIPAGRLINGTTVAQVAVERVAYWHVELDGHDILLAEGLPAESYLECGNRGFFAGADAADLAALPDARPAGPAPFCRPFHEAGPLVELLRARLQERAEALGWHLVEEAFAGLHVVADGQTIRPDVEGLRARFVLPAEARDVRLVSAASIPAHVLAGATDERRLGVSLAALGIDDGLTGARAIALDDPRLADGFHPVDGADAAASWRWTDGSAVLPADLWAGCQGVFFLQVRLSGAALPRWVGPGETAGVVDLAAFRQRV